jgi:hypothetical protein
MCEQFSLEVDPILSNFFIQFLKGSSLKIQIRLGGTQGMPFIFHKAFKSMQTGNL